MFQSNILVLMPIHAFVDNALEVSFVGFNYATCRFFSSQTMPQKIC